MSSPSKQSPDEIVAKRRNKELAVMTVVLTVLVGLAFLSYFVGAEKPVVTETGLIAGAPDNPKFKTEDVAKIVISKSDNDQTVTLTRAGDTWNLKERYGFLANTEDVKTLLTRLHDARRYTEPSITDESQYALYNLDDASAAHLKLFDKSGELLLHLLAGKSPQASRDFIRYVGDDAPDGIFEIANTRSQWDTVVGRMRLNASGDPDPKSWLDLSSLVIVPKEAEVTSLTIVNDDNKVSFHIVEDTNGRRWESMLPFQAVGKSQIIDGALDELRTTKILDIAGPLHPDGPKLGLGQPDKWIEVQYIADANTGKSTTLRLSLGNRDDGRIAAHVSDGSGKKYAWWINDYLVDKVFRPTLDYFEMQKASFLPTGIQPTAVRAQYPDGDATVLFNAVEREEPTGGKAWKLLQPEEVDVNPRAPVQLAMDLRGLKLIKPKNTIDRDVRKLGPTISEQWVEMDWIEEKPSEEEGVDPTRTTKTLGVYVGTTVDGATALLVREPDGTETVYLADVEQASKIIPSTPDWKQVQVRHILISWQGMGTGATRSEEEARTLVADVLKQAKEPDADFVALQKAHNEDSDKTHVYDVSKDSNLVPEFRNLSLRLKVGEVDTAETRYGIHIIKRIK